MFKHTNIMKCISTCCRVLRKPKIETGQCEKLQSVVGVTGGPSVCVESFFYKFTVFIKNHLIDKMKQRQYCYKNKDNGLLGCSMLHKYRLCVCHTSCAVFVVVFVFQLLKIDSKSIN